MPLCTKDFEKFGFKHSYTSEDKYLIEYTSKSKEYLIKLFYTPSLNRTAVYCSSHDFIIINTIEILNNKELNFVMCRTASPFLQKKSNCVTHPKTHS